MKLPIPRTPSYAPRSAWLLILGVIVLALASVRAVTAMREQAEAVDRALRDQARTAVWSYSQLLRPFYLDLLEHLFHETAHIEAGRHLLPYEPRRIIPLPTELLTAHDEPECDALHGPIGYAVRFFAHDTALTFAGRPVDHAALASLRLRTIEHARRTEPPRHTEHAFAWMTATTPFIAAYSEQVLAAGDTAYYVVLLDSAAIAPLLRRVPAAAVAGAALSPAGAEHGMTLSLLVDGAALHAGRATRIVEHAALPYLAGVALSVGIDDEAGILQRSGAVPLSPVPLLVAAIIIASGLVALGLQQVRREARLARMRADFVSSVSHELRTPLALQRIFLDMLRLGRARTEAEQQWSLDTIDRENARLTHLVNNILQFSRIQRSAASLHPVPQCLSAATQDVVARFQPLAAARGSGIVLDISADARVALDGGAFAQALGNVLENAIKYGPDGQTINVTVTRADGRARVTTEDRGPGVRLQDRDRIFEPFWRGTGPVESAVGGSGIGLSVVRDLMSSHGGHVTVVDGAAGHGARFVLEFPIVMDS